MAKAFQMSSVAAPVTLSRFRKFAEQSHELYAARFASHYPDIRLRNVSICSGHHRGEIAIRPFAYRVALTGGACSMSALLAILCS